MVRVFLFACGLGGLDVYGYMQGYL
jgi:hypothetical protein